MPVPEADAVVTRDGHEKAAIGGEGGEPKGCCVSPEDCGLQRVLRETQIRAVRSFDAVTTKRLSEEKVADLTQPVCPLSTVARSGSCSVSQMWAVLSAHAVAKKRPSWEKVAERTKPACLSSSVARGGFCSRSQRNTLPPNDAVKTKRPSGEKVANLLARRARQALVRSSAQCHTGASAPPDGQVPPMPHPAPRTCSNPQAG